MHENKGVPTTFDQDCGYELLLQFDLNGILVRRENVRLACRQHSNTVDIKVTATIYLSKRKIYISLSLNACCEKLKLFYFYFFAFFFFLLGFKA